MKPVLSEYRKKRLDKAHERFEELIQLSKKHNITLPHSKLCHRISRMGLNDLVNYLNHLDQVIALKILTNEPSKKEFFKKVLNE